MADDIFKIIVGFVNDVGKPAGKVVESTTFWVVLVVAGLAFCIWQMFAWHIPWYYLPVGIIIVWLVYRLGIWGWELLQQY